MAGYRAAHAAGSGQVDAGEGRVYDKERKPLVARLLKAILILLGVLIAAIALLICFLTVTEYRPADTQTVAVADADVAKKTVSPGDTLTVLTWNVGYCGLSDEADFFMDGGRGVRTVTEEGVRSNLADVGSLLGTLQPDVVFMQEVDRNSSRSYHIDEASALAEDLGAQGYSNAFANNFKVSFLPYPVPPIGAVDSGIATFNSLAAAQTAERIQLPCPFSWPVRVANLKRCLLVERVPVAGTDRELVLVNLHLEAYDDGEGKAAQTAQLVSLMRAEAEEGNYVVVGGDFNQSFSNVDTSAYPLQGEGLWECGLIDVADLGEDFSAVMDPTVPTCRSLDRPYDPDDPDFQYFMIDGFIVSANVAVDSIETIDTGFDYSDHNPVLLTATLA